MVIKISTKIDHKFFPLKSDFKTVIQKFELKVTIQFIKKSEIQQNKFNK